MAQTYEKNGSFVELLGSPRVFVHEINTLPGFEKIIPKVDGIEKYDRVLAISGPNDVVFLKTKPEEAYVRWLEEVGFGTRKVVVLAGEENETLPERILKNGARKKLEALLKNDKKQAVLSPYYGGELEKQISDYLGLFMYAETEAVKKFDSKINFKNLCRDIGVPVIGDTIFNAEQGVPELLKLIYNMMAYKTGKVVVRGEYGASASTTYIFNSLDLSLAEEIIKNSKPDERYLIEPFYTASSSPSSVWFITKDRKIVHLKTSNQLLDGGISHIGNEFPVKFNERYVNELSFHIAKHIAKEGFMGPFGIDYVETERGMYATECNPRVTGAMYPWELVNKLEKKHGLIKAARSENIHLPKKGVKFEELKTVWKDALYDGTRNLGVVFPFNVGPISEGKITILGTGSSKEEVDFLFGNIKSDLRKLMHLS